MVASPGPKPLDPNCTLNRCGYGFITEGHTNLIVELIWIGVEEKTQVRICDSSGNEVQSWHVPGKPEISERAAREILIEWLQQWDQNQWP